MKLQIKNHPEVFFSFLGWWWCLILQLFLPLKKFLPVGISIYSNLVSINTNFKVGAIMPRPLPESLNAGFCCYNIAASSESCLKFKWPLYLLKYSLMWFSKLGKYTINEAGEVRLLLVEELKGKSGTPISEFSSFH